MDNKPGAGTIIGTDNVAKSAPDGYSVVVASFAHAVNPALQAKLPYGSNKAFAPVILIGRGPNVLVVPAASPYKTVADVMAAAKASPDKLTYASQAQERRRIWRVSCLPTWPRSGSPMCPTVAQARHSPI